MIARWAASIAGRRSSDDVLRTVFGAWPSSSMTVMARTAGLTSRNSWRTPLSTAVSSAPQLEVVGNGTRGDSRSADQLALHPRGEHPELEEGSGAHDDGDDESDQQRQPGAEESGRSKRATAWRSCPRAMPSATSTFMN